MDKELTKAQENLLEYCEEVGWGKVEVKVKNGQPVMLRVIEKDIKLD